MLDDLQVTWRFDFEDFIDEEDAKAAVAQAHQHKRRHRKSQTVCRFWLRGMCQNGDDCGFEHSTEGAMPVCQFYKIS